MAKRERTKVKRGPQKGLYQKQDIYHILDSAHLCHVGIIHEGYPVVIPMAYGRKEDLVYIHGATKSRLMKNLQDGAELCITVTLLDGLVLARSLFHHSMNYRSVVLFGKAIEIEKENEKIEALRIITDHIITGRWKECREPNEKELKGTKIFVLPIDEASAKIRTGPPLDEKKDYHLDFWAGVIPLTTSAGYPVPDPELNNGKPIPESVINFLETFNEEKA